VGRLGRIWELFKASFNVLSLDSEILLLPLISGISMAALGISFFVPFYQSGALRLLAERKGGWEEYAAMFLWYYANFFIGIFFNSAIAGCANIRLSGGDPTLADGFRIAFSRIGKIAMWALFATTVGVFLSSMRKRGNLIFRIIGASLEIAWSLITYLIVPVILFENRSVYDSIYRSQELFRKNWGDQVAGSFGFGFLGFLLCLPALLIAALAWKVDPALGIIMGIVYLIILSLVMSAARGVFTVALYRYATQGDAPSGFSGQAIDEALGGRPRDRFNTTWPS
jgi:hypothetical protein